MATVQWRWTATRPSGWVASTTATGLTERLCSTSCCGTSARSSQSSTPTTAWPAELTRPYSTRSGVPEWSWASREYMDAPFHRTFFCWFLSFVSRINRILLNSAKSMASCLLLNKRFINVVLLWWYLQSIYVSECFFCVDPTKKKSYFLWCLWRKVTNHLDQSYNMSQKLNSNVTMWGVDWFDSSFWFFAPFERS